LVLWATKGWGSTSTVGGVRILEVRGRSTLGELETRRAGVELGEEQE